MQNSALFCVFCFAGPVEYLRCGVSAKYTKHCAHGPYRGDPANGAEEGVRTSCQVLVGSLDGAQFPKDAKYRCLGGKCDLKLNYHWQTEKHRRACARQVVTTSFCSLCGYRTDNLPPHIEPFHPGAVGMGESGGYANGGGTPDKKWLQKYIAAQGLQDIPENPPGAHLRVLHWDCGGGGITPITYKDENVGGARSEAQG
jgi:hypothetical protein